VPLVFLVLLCGLLMEIRTILLPTDFSECGNYALSYAASLARTFKASIICVNVIEPIVPTVGYSGMTEPMPIADITEQLEDSAERELPKLAECDECSGLDVEELVVHGEAASEIVRVAAERNVDLIVIYGRIGGQTRPLPGVGSKASSARRNRTVVNNDPSSLFFDPPANEVRSQVFDRLIY
jgi:nucleotide-binding universal stress UspA family protein